MDLGTQAKILRAVESGSIERLGGTQPVPVDVRLIKRDHKSPETAIREGRFRQDLYFRLAAVTLFIPPLRDRREDIPSLVTRFWQDAQKKYARPGPEFDARCDSPAAGRSVARERSPTAQHHGAAVRPRDP